MSSEPHSAQHHATPYRVSEGYQAGNYRTFSAEDFATAIEGFAGRERTQKLSAIPYIAAHHWPRAYEFLVNTSTKDPDPTVRAAAVHALGARLAADDFAPIQHALLDKDKEVRSAAAEAMRLGDALEVVIPALAPLWNDRSRAVQHLAFDSLCSSAEASTWGDFHTGRQFARQLLDAHPEVHWPSDLVAAVRARAKPEQHRLLCLAALLDSVKAELALDRQQHLAGASKKSLPGKAPRL